MTNPIAMHAPPLQRQDFHYDLPPDRIAQHPPAQRGQSRLLALDGDGAVRDLQFQDVSTLLRAGDLLVFNDTRVIPARLHGRKATGGRIEILVEQVLDETRALVHLHASKTPKPGTLLHLDAGFTVRMIARHDNLFEIRVVDNPDNTPLLALLEQHGQIPLPPYIQRAPAVEDADRYQTVYAREPGAVAAPTAGLHFDHVLLDRLTAQGIDQAFVTLHVGAGTFQPLRVDRLSDHIMHAERLEVSAAVCDQIRATRERGGRIVAVGTTTVRALESAAQHGEIAPWCGETRLFIVPGYDFRCVDALITNFHLPESTLLMLVSAFAGRTEIFKAYHHAIAHHYRFFSYGDAMFLTRR